MEIIIAVAVFGFGLWWVFLRTPADTTPSAPYKVEPPKDTTDVVPVSAGDFPVVTETVEVPPVVEEVVVLAPVEAAPVKKPRKPRAPKVVAPAEKPATKKAAPVKKAAAIKAKAAPKKAKPGKS